MKKIKEFIGSIFKDRRKTFIALFVLFVVIVVIAGVSSSIKDKKLREEAIKRGEELSKESDESTEESTSNDSYLMQIQPDLIESYGQVPKGYIWDTDGTLLSLGDKSMSAEDVVYAYLNGLRSLDLSMAQKYSRRSSVVSTYEEYFDSSSPTSDYYDSFLRNMYKEVLLSIEPGSIVDSTVFAENKQVFTVKLNVLDLTSKDFWLVDKDTIYNNLYVYSNEESDSTKGSNYLYDYVLSYYRSEDAVKRDVTVNLTVEKYPDLDTGWLVSIDSDINDICNYKDGNLIVNYIQRQYQTEGRQYMEDKNMSTEEVTSEEATGATSEESQE